MNWFELASSLASREILLFALCAALIGMAKAGVKGMGMLAVPILASVFGGKASAGIMLPLLTFADIFAIAYYNRHSNWEYIIKLMPSAMIGVLLGVWVGALINDDTFKILMGILIVIGLGLMIFLEWKALPARVTTSWWFASVFGALGGFSTMIGNAAGPVMAVYLLSTRISKNEFIGTGAWFFALINIFKWPFHVFVWKTISWPTFGLDVLGIPAIALGVWLGVVIIKRINEKTFRYFIIGMTFLIALRLIFGA
ncbi:MAG: sulfite exporter TauE/SafE family protein [Bacteroidota bacterium]